MSFLSFLTFFVGARCEILEYCVLNFDYCPGKSKSAIDKIYDVIREMIPASGKNTLKMSEIKERCTSKGFKPDKIEECITEYERLNIFHVNDTRTKITFVDAV